MMQKITLNTYVRPVVVNTDQYSRQIFVEFNLV